MKRSVICVLSIGTGPSGDMLIYAQGMYIMHVPVDASQENRGSQTLYIPGLTFLSYFVSERHRLRLVGRCFCSGSVDSL